MGDGWRVERCVKDQVAVVLDCKHMLEEVASLEDARTEVRMGRGLYVLSS